ncbi:hypothetical protein GW17_00047230 [Ensete ventricosum]|nr:hypothetical protein GW17_00047230 [Ensete ventricosum]
MYNVILGRSVLKKMRVIVSTYHRAMKFLTQVGIREVRSDPREFKQCYLATIMLPKKLKHGLNHSTLKEAEQPQSPFDRPLVDPHETTETPHQLKLMEKMGKLLGHLTNLGLDDRHCHWAHLFLELSDLNSKPVRESSLITLLESHTLSMSPTEK